MVRVGWASRQPARAEGDDLVQDIVDQGSTVNKPDILAVTAARATKSEPRTLVSDQSEPRTSVSGWI